MASLKIQTNLRMIESVLSTTPTTTQVPLGHCAFGLADGKVSIWGNYNNTEVVDLIAAGQVNVEIVQETGDSTTAVMSQNAATNAFLLSSLRNAVSGFAGLDTNAKLLPAQLPDYIMSGLLFGGTINKTGVATLSAAFKSKYDISASTITLTSGAASTYPGAYFIAQDTEAFTDQTIIGVANVSTGDWIISIGTSWEKIDNTDTVISVNSKTGAVVLGGADIASTFTQAGDRVNLVSTEKLDVSLGKIMKWLADLKDLAFKTKIDPTSDIESDKIIPTGNLPVAVGEDEDDEPIHGIVAIPETGSGIKNFLGIIGINAGDGLKFTEGKMPSGNKLTIDYGDGLKISNGKLVPDIVLEIVTI